MAWKDKPRSEKVMIIIIIMLIIGIITRWEYVKTELTSSVSRYFTPDTTLIAK